MNNLIDIWLKFGYAVYWIFWIGSAALGLTTLKGGILIGFCAFFIWFVVLAVMCRIAFGTWLVGPIFEKLIGR